MKQETKNIALFVSVALLFTAIGFFAKQTAGERLGATYYTTQLTDTINIFRTNVNSSLDNINAQLVGSTSTDPGHKHTSSSLSGVGNFTTSSIGNASGTNGTFSGFLQVFGSTTLQHLSFVNASGTQNLTLLGYLTAPTLNWTNARGSSLNLTGNTNVSGTLDVTGATALGILNVFGKTSLTNGSTTGNFQVGGELLDAGSNKFVTSTGNVKYVVWYPGDCVLNNVTVAIGTGDPYWNIANNTNGDIGCIARVPPGVSQVSSTFVYMIDEASGNLEHFERYASANLNGTFTTDEPAGVTTTAMNAGNDLVRIIPQATGYNGLDTDLKEDDVVRFVWSNTGGNAGDTYEATKRIYSIIMYFK